MSSPHVSNHWRIRWAVSAVDDNGEPVTPRGDGDEPVEVAIGLTNHDMPVIVVGDCVAYLEQKLALDASTGLRTIIEQAMRAAGEL